MTIEDDRHRPRVVYRNAQLRQGEGMSPSLMGLTHLHEAYIYCASIGRSVLGREPEDRIYI
jgi:hypothetical protein